MTTDFAVASMFDQFECMYDHVFYCQSAISECSPPLPDSNSAPKSVVGVSHGVFHSRPISLLSIFDKILEKLMYSRLYNYLCANNILSDNQFGFREGEIVSLCYLRTAVCLSPSAVS